MSGIVWWEIETPRPEDFQWFHGPLWGWTFAPAFAGTELGADYWLVQLDGRGIGGLQRAATDAPPHAGARLYVEVADLEAVLDAVAARGGTVERRRTALGADDRWFATALDPTGVSFGMWTANPPADRGTARPADPASATVTRPEPEPQPEPQPEQQPAVIRARNPATDPGAC